VESLEVDVALNEGSNALGSLTELPSDISGGHDAGINSLDHHPPMQQLQRDVRAGITASTSPRSHRSRKRRHAADFAVKW